MFGFPHRRQAVKRKFEKRRNEKNVSNCFNLISMNIKQEILNFNKLSKAYKDKDRKRNRERETQSLIKTSRGINIYFNIVRNRREL